MICIPIIAKNTDEASEKMARVDTLADMFEVRLDMMYTFDLRKILRAAPKPVLATYRSRQEGGKGGADRGVGPGKAGPSPGNGHLLYQYSRGISGGTAGFPQDEID